MTPVLYVESSALLQVALSDDARLLQPVGGFPNLITSALTIAEVERVLLRASLDGRITDDERSSLLAWLRKFVAGCLVIDVSARVLQRAGEPFPVEPLRTLDAIHLATTVAFEGEVGCNMTMLSAERRVRVNASKLGFAVLPA